MLRKLIFNLPKYDKYVNSNNCISLSRRFIGSTSVSKANPKTTVKVRTEDFKKSNLQKDIQDQQNIVFNERFNISYVQLHRNDRILNNLMLLIKSKKHRNDQIIVEGRTMIKEGIRHNLNLTHLLFSKIENLEPFLNDIKNLKKTELYKTFQHDLKTWSVLTTCPGVIGVFDKRVMEEDRNSLPISIICDNIREPNNLGSIFRVGKAINCRKIILTKGCTDPWDTKCIRASAGTIFSTPFTKHPLEWVELYKMLEEYRNNSIVYLADNNTQNYARQSAISYENMQVSDIVFVIIGGENHGISQDAKRFAEHFSDFKCVYIPMADNIDSLNTACALSVVLFELRRKFLNHVTSD